MQRDPLAGRSMNKQAHVVAEQGVMPHTGFRLALESARLYLGYLSLGLMCLVFSLPAMAMRLFLPRALGLRLGRSLIAGILRTYLSLLKWTGACRFDISALDALRGGPPVIVAPNHPSLLDALLILSHLPGTGCIMKSGIVKSPFFGAAARLAGYICNTPLRGMFQKAAEDLRRGNHLLLFPEGTRSERFPLGRLQGTAALISRQAGVGVQTVFIETDSGFLGKGWPVLLAPRMPVTYRLRLGKCFAPPVDIESFTAELEQYFQAELGRSQLLKWLPPSAITPDT